MADPKTAGYKTSEFWVGVITSIFVALNGAGVLPFVVPDNIINMIAGVAATYIAGRLGLKAVASNSAAKVEVATVAADAKVAAANVTAGSAPVTDPSAPGYKV